MFGEFVVIFGVISCTQQNIVLPSILYPAVLSKGMPRERCNVGADAGHHVINFQSMTTSVQK